MATTTKPQLNQQFSTPQEALSQIVGGGAQMVYEARWALEQIRELVSQGAVDQQKGLEIVEPLARAIGWAEALVFEQATDGPAVATFGNGGQQGRN